MSLYVSYGLHDIQIAQMAVPDDWDALVRNAETGSLAKTIGMVGLIAKPMVRKSDGRIVCGLHRIAAHARQKLDTCKIELIECSDDEAEVLGRHENAYRRSYKKGERDKLIAESVPFYEAAIRARPVAPPEPPVQSRQDEHRRKAKEEKAVKREAVASAAAAANVTPDAAAHAVNRVAREDAPVEPVAPWAFPTLGMELDKMTLTQIELVDKSLASLHGKLGAVAVLMGNLERLRGIHATRLQGARNQLTALLGFVTGMRPHSVCPWCKCVDDVRVKCSTCEARGYIVRDQRDGIPTELLDETDLVVSFGGKLVPVMQFFEGEPAHLPGGVSLVPPEEAWVPVEGNNPDVPVPTDDDATPPDDEEALPWD